MARLTAVTCTFLLLFSLVASTPFDFGKLLIQKPTEFVEGEYRLPTNTAPISYKIRLTTNIHDKEAGDERFKFYGKVAITLEAKEETNYITIHSRQITIDQASVKLVLASDETVVIPVEDELDNDKKHEFVTFFVGNDVKLAAGEKYVLSMDYEGILRNDNQGFYRSYYKNEKDEEVWLATTQLESTDARHAFPCYDEPSIRAKFEFTIDCGLPYYAVSNMPIKSTDIVSR